MIIDNYTLDDAYDLMDLLLDKADQPYFTTSEKNKFLDLAISDFIHFNYQKMSIDENSRRALSGCIDYVHFQLENSEILTPQILDDIYPLGWADANSKGYWMFDSQYVLPRRHLYTLVVGVKYFNRDEIIDSNGDVFPGKTSSDIVRSETVNVKNKSNRDYYEGYRTEDPFNTPSKENPSWAYRENRINFSSRHDICDVYMHLILMPTINEAFRGVADEPHQAPRFQKHYQKRIIELAVDKMTRVDVGLMTPPSQ